MSRYLVGQKKTHSTPKIRLNMGRIHEKSSKYLLKEEISGLPPFRDRG